MPPTGFAFELKRPLESADDFVRVNAPIRLCLVMSLETTPEHVDFYSAIEVALDMPVMTTIVVYDAPTGLLVPWVAAAADDVDQLHHP